MKNEGWRKYLCESLQPKPLFSVKEALVVARVTPSGIHSPGSSRVFSEGTGRHLVTTPPLTPPGYDHVVSIAQFSSTETNNMDAAVAGKRKHFDTDEDASNRKVISS